MLESFVTQGRALIGDRVSFAALFASIAGLILVGLLIIFYYPGGDQIWRDATSEQTPVESKLLLLVVLALVAVVLGLISESLQSLVFRIWTGAPGTWPVWLSSAWRCLRVPGDPDRETAAGHWRLCWRQDVRAALAAPRNRDRSESELNRLEEASAALEQAENPDTGRPPPGTSVKSSKLLEEIENLRHPTTSTLEGDAKRLVTFFHEARASGDPALEEQAVRKLVERTARWKDLVQARRAQLDLDITICERSLRADTSKALHATRLGATFELEGNAMRQRIGIDPGLLLPYLRESLPSDGLQRLDGTGAKLSLHLNLATWCLVLGAVALLPALSSPLAAGIMLLLAVPVVVMTFIWPGVTLLLSIAPAVFGPVVGSELGSLGAPGWALLAVAASAFFYRAALVQADSVIRTTVALVDLNRTALLIRLGPSGAAPVNAGEEREQWKKIAKHIERGEPLSAAMEFVVPKQAIAAGELITEENVEIRKLIVADKRLPYVTTFGGASGQATLWGLAKDEPIPATLLRPAEELRGLVVAWVVIGKGYSKLSTLPPGTRILLSDPSDFGTSYAANVLSLDQGQDHDNLCVAVATAFKTALLKRDVVYIPVFDYPTAIPPAVPVAADAGS